METQRHSARLELDYANLAIGRTCTQFSITHVNCNQYQQLISAQLSDQCASPHFLGIFLLYVLVFRKVISATTEDCLNCICKRESGCKPTGCHMDVGSLSCGYYQIKLDYYKDCGTPGRNRGESVIAAWKRCANDYSCSTTCVKAYYNRYKRLCPSSQGTCQKMARLHNGGPSGCKKQATVGYWNAVKKCCGCS